MAIDIYSYTLELQRFLSMYHDQCPRNMSLHNLARLSYRLLGVLMVRIWIKGGMTICQSVLIYSLQIVNLFKNLKIGRVKLRAAFGKG